MKPVRLPGSFRRNVLCHNHDAAIGVRSGLDENAVLRAIVHSAGHRAACRDRHGAVAVLLGVDPVPAGLHRAGHADADAARAVALAGPHAVIRLRRTRLHVAANLNGDVAGSAVLREHGCSALALDVPGRGNRQLRVGAAVDADSAAAAAGPVHGDRHGGSGGVFILDVDGILARSGAFDGPCRRHRDAARALLTHPYAVLAARNGRRLDRHAPARSVAVDRDGRGGGLHLRIAGDIIAANRRLECPAAHGNRSAADVGQVDPVGPPGDAARHRDGDRAGAGIADKHAASARRDDDGPGRDVDVAFRGDADAMIARARSGCGDLARNADADGSRSAAGHVYSIAAGGGDGVRADRNIAAASLMAHPDAAAAFAGACSHALDGSGRDHDDIAAAAVHDIYADVA